MVKYFDTTFELSPSFLAKYEHRPVKYGFGVFGYIVSKRYARLKPNGTGESWFDIVKRVVEGAYAIQKHHIASIGKTWNDKKATKSSQRMFDRVFNMKFCPAGRGLYAMGTSIVELKGGAALNNCGYISTKNLRHDPIKPFLFLMLMSMLGVGVGFDTLGEDQVMVLKSTSDPVMFTIPDTREGWAESVKLLLESYLLNGHNVTFNYAEIRKKGVPLKIFGGISSGPQPLIDAHNTLREILDKNNGHPITVTTIVDIMNVLGKCVVSGGIRRTAEIALGYKSDEFLNLKNYEEHPERVSYGWVSNNSVFVEVGDDYSDIVERIYDNGEPGLCWLSNMRKFSRMCDPADNKDLLVDGANPCVTGETFVMTSEGPKQVVDLLNTAFKVVVNKEMYDCKTGFFKTGSKPVYELVTYDGYKLKLTGDHKVLRKSNGTSEWIEAEKLKYGDLVVLNNSRVDLEWDGTDKTLFGVQQFGTSILKTSSKLQRGFLKCLCEDRGKFNTTNVPSINLQLDNLQQLEIVQQMLLNFGIKSHICLDAGQYFNNLVITGDNLAVFAQRIHPSGFPYPEISLAEKTREEFVTSVKSFTYVGVEDVYDCTVEDAHCFSANGLIVHNCCEQSLRSFELCNLVEVFINLVDSLEEFLEVLKDAFLYAKTVTLVMTDCEETNEIIRQNRRIGCSISGVAQFLAKHTHEELRRWLKIGYSKLKYYDTIYSNWLDINESVKITSNKPGGSVCCVVGATSGLSDPIARFVLRRIRLNSDNELIPRMREDGYNIIEDVPNEPNTTIAEIPVDFGEGVRSTDDVPMWEQLARCALFQEVWADNQVSATIMFNKNIDMPHHIKSALEIYETKLKGISFLPRTENKYMYPPNEKITEERYRELISKIKINIDYVTTIEPEQEKGCDGEFCEFIPVAKQTKTNYD